MLTAKAIKSIQPTDSQQNKSTGDGNGLTICTAPKKKSGHQWFEGRFRYRGKSDSLYLGTFDKQISLKEARDKWRKIYSWYHKNDCLIHPKNYKLQDNKKYTFGDAVDLYFKKKKNLKTSTLKDNRNRLFNLVLPALGKTTPLVLLEWNKGGRKTVQEFLYTYTVQGKLDSERKLRGLIRQVCELAIQEGWMKEGQNPAPKSTVQTEVKTVEHHPSIAWEKVPKLLEDIETNSCNGAIEVVLAVKFMLMTFLRVGALVRLEWDWYDEDQDCWIIPSQTTGLKRKLGVVNRPHHIPVTKELRLLMNKLKKLFGHQKYVFFSPRGKRFRHICPDAPNNHLKRLGYKGILRAHGWRQVPTTAGQEVLKVNRDIIKRQLGHLIGDKIFQAYDSQTQMLDERRKFLDAWTAALVDKGMKI